jgi:hypothetical protein
VLNDPDTRPLLFTPPEDRVPAIVREFLFAHVTNLGDLKVLVTLINGGDRWWDARSVAVYAGVDVADARRCLEEFAVKNLLDIRISDAVRYQLRPGTRELEGRLEALITAYRKSPADVVGCATDLFRDLASKAGRI